MTTLTTERNGESGSPVTAAATPLVPTNTTAVVAATRKRAERRGALWRLRFARRQVAGCLRQFGVGHQLQALIDVGRVRAQKLRNVVVGKCRQVFTSGHKVNQQGVFLDGKEVSVNVLSSRGHLLGRIYAQPRQGAVLCDTYRSWSHPECTTRFFCRQTDSHSQHQKLAEVVGEAIEQHAHHVRVTRLQGTFLRAKGKVDPIGDVCSGNRGAKCRALHICHLVRGNAEDESLERPTFIAVSRERMEHGEQYLLRRVIGGEVGCWGAPESTPAVADNHRSKMSQQRFLCTHLAKSGAGDEIAKVAILRPMEDRPPTSRRYIGRHDPHLLKVPHLR